MNKCKIFNKLILTTMLCIGNVWGQGSGYLAQKLMVENDLRQRITDALSKVIDDRKYVIDVNAEIEITGGTEEQITILDEGQRSGRQALQELSSAVSREIQSSARDQSVGISSGLPIPGFEFESDAAAEPVPSATIPQADESTPSFAVEGQDKVLSRTVTSKYPSTAKIKKLDISIILQEGAAPEMIENIRQVVMVAARFNRARGDALSIITASFKERRDEKTAEQVLLKNIAEKLESLEQQQSGEGFVNWKEELDDYKAEEAQRREEDRIYFQQKLTGLESAARERAYQAEKKGILRRDSLKLQALNQEIASLKAMMSSSDITGTEADQTENAIGEKVGEKEALDTQITEKLAMLDAVQSDLDRNINGDSSTMMIFLISVLGALVIVLLGFLAIVIMGNRQKQQQIPPPWMYPPRKRKKKSENLTNQQSVAATKPPSLIEDQSVLQSEVSDMRQAVVSMSVGQPQTATRIVKEWMEEEAPPEPETEVQQPEPEEEDTGKKKKKKKK